MEPPDEEGVRFERCMLERYGCITVSVIAGPRRATILWAEVLSVGVFCTPAFVVRLLHHWFGGEPAGFRVRPLTVGLFEFQVAHASIAWEIVRRRVW